MITLLVGCVTVLFESIAKDKDLHMWPCHMQILNNFSDPGDSF